MKNSKPSHERTADANIDQYCQSVAELLKTINRKSGAGPQQRAPEESCDMDYEEEMFPYPDHDPYN